MVLVSEVFEGLGGFLYIFGGGTGGVKSDKIGKVILKKLGSDLVV